MDDNAETEQPTPLRFRTSPTQANVLKVTKDKAARRIGFELIAKISLKNFKITPHKDYVLSETEQSQIAQWIEARSNSVMTYEEHQFQQRLEALGALAHWFEQEASDAQVVDHAQEALLAIADLRNAINHAEAKARRRGAKPQKGVGESTRSA